MKKIVPMLLSICSAAAFILAVSAAAADTELQLRYAAMKPALIVLIAIFAILALSSIGFTAMIASAKRKSKSHRRNPSSKLLQGILYAATCLVLVCTVFCYTRYQDLGEELMSADAPPAGDTQQAAPSTSTGPADTTESTDTVPEDTTQETAPPTDPDPTISPAYTDLSNPENWGIKWEIIQGGAIVDSYKQTEPISFGKPQDYFALPGIATFRGNNYRSGATYGTAQVTEKTITPVWTSSIGSLNGWPGSGWTGQPLIVQWDDDTKAIMNLYEDKKAKDGLVEVIYATLDGYIYFYDLEDGTYTRDPLYVGMNFKGAGSLDPRGYPIMYVGSGDYIGDTAPRMYIISLVDCSILYERSGNDAFCQRSWVAWDSSPLVDAETDTLIWPAESGLLYTIKLNTAYDKAAGTLTMSPEEMIKTRYATNRSNSSTYWVGYEPSAVIVDSYLYISENGGMFYCIDLNAMELVWAQDTRDDSNSTPVFQWDDDGNGYIYTAPSLHWTADGSGSGYICIYKLNAQTGEIVWEHRFDVHTVSGVSGGVQSTPLLGPEGTDLEGLILYTVARTPNVGDGVLVALDVNTGETVWEKYMDCYSWSSPVAFYTDDGTSYVILCDSVGYMRLLNAQGEVLATIGLGSNIEASPAIFNDMLVIGTRGQQIYGIQIK